MIKFQEWNCDVVKRNYSNGRTALQLVESETGEPIATATVNIPEISLEPNEIIIKDYSENEGIFEALVKAGIVISTGKMVENGFVKCPICIYIPQTIKENSYA
jgi:hypothetical protein